MARPKMKKSAKKSVKPAAKKTMKKSTKKPVTKTKATKTKAKRATKKTSKRSKKVSAIPKGYATVTSYLIVDNAAQAIDFYKQAFAAKVGMLMHSPSGKVMHAELKIGDSKIMLADESPEMNALSPKALKGSATALHMYVKNVDKVLSSAVNAGAELVRPAADMYYGDRIGTVVDPFGHKWSIATHIEDVTPAQMRKRAAAMHSDM